MQTMIGEPEKYDSEGGKRGRGLADEAVFDGVFDEFGGRLQA